MSTPVDLVYEFDEFCLDPRRRVLLRGGDPVPLTPKAFDTLLVLVCRSGHVVAKDALLREVWPDTFVEEATLAQNVFTLRRALGQGRTDQQFIETVPKYGYRFVADVRVRRGESTEVVVERRTRTHIVTEDVDDTDASRECEHDSPRPGSEVAVGNGHSNFASGMSVVPGRAAVVPRIGGASRFLNPVRSRPAIVVCVSVSAIAAAIVLWVGLRGRFGDGAPPPEPFQRMRVSKLTSSGKSVRAAVSPDGKYVATVSRDGALESLWLRQSAATNAIQVVPPAETFYRGVVFSPDGGSVYYVAYRRDSPVASLYQTPVLGGTPREVLADIDSIVTFSPDGRRVAYVRGGADGAESSLVVANVDGTDVRKIATRSDPDFYSLDGLAWSPDGAVIACAAGRGEFNRTKMSVVEVRLEDGVEQLVSPRRWDAVGQLAWLADGSGIVMSAWDTSVSLLSAQIWLLSYPGGEARRVTNDMNSYHGVSLTAGDDVLVTVRSDRSANFWVATNGEFGRAARITSGSGDSVGEAMGVSWTSDGRIVYGSNAGGGIDVWIMDADASNQRQLTLDPRHDLKPSVSPDGRFVVFVSWRTGKTHLWRMGLDGADLKQLTDGDGETYPSVSPDGRWVVYSSYGGGRPTLWRTPTEGGPAVRLTNASATYPSVSPDGKWVACFHEDGQKAANKIALIPFGGGDPVKLFDAPPRTFTQAGLHWAADGGAVTYVADQGGVSNIWSQPVGGGQPTRITDFTSDRIFRFAWSRDGTRLAVERGVDIRDAVVITDFK
jgi:Tol biopolymer transport system component/DNA-binding winged helix-turn-helix (wHTH) protein